LKRSSLVKGPWSVGIVLLFFGTLIGASSTLGCAAEPEPSAGEEVGHAAHAWSASCSAGVCTSASVNLTIAQGSTPGCTAAGATATGVVDTQRNEENPSTPQSPSIVSIATGPNRNGDLRYSLLQFPVSALPYGTNLNESAVNVYNAYMTLTLGRINPSGAGTVNVHEVTSAWTQATATWNNPPTWSTDVVTTFDVASADTAGTALDNASGTGLSTLVQGCMASPATNRPTRTTAAPAATPARRATRARTAPVPRPAAGPSADGIAFDGTNMWVVDLGSEGNGKVTKL
jgi:hypothetical protein